MVVYTNETYITGWLIIQIGRLQNHCILNGLQRGVPLHGTFFLEDKNGLTVSVNSMWYEEMLKTFFGIEKTSSCPKTNLVSTGWSHSIVPIQSISVKNKNLVIDSCDALCPHGNLRARLN